MLQDQAARLHAMTVHRQLNQPSIVTSLGPDRVLLLPWNSLVEVKAAGGMPLGLCSEATVHQVVQVVLCCPVAACVPYGRQGQGGIGQLIWAGAALTQHAAIKVCRHRITKTDTLGAP